jgi:hypothetical protein
MALFTDGPASSMEDLMAQDTQVLNVANVEGIDIAQKLFLAQEELGLELHTLLDGSTRAEPAFWLTPAATIQNVVVTPALKLWHTFRTLQMVYQDAYSDQLNDRYAAKRDQFEQRANWAYDKLLLVGIGIVGSPVPKAKEPQVVSAAGSLANGTYYVTIAWTNNKGQAGVPSLPTVFTSVASTLLVQPSVPPTSAAGWNVYVGTDPGALSQQNASPIAVAQPWLQPTTIAAGSVPGWGQSPDYLLPAPRMILRG